jgi:hypothetical protein
MYATVNTTVISTNISGANQDAMEVRDFIVGIVTPIDLLEYVTSAENAEKSMAHQDDLI